MRNEYFRAIALDYDGTLAEGGKPSADVLEALAECRRAGRTILLVTGRILGELREVFPDVDRHFDAVVAENGAVTTMGGATRLLCPPVEFELDEALVRRAVPFRRGQVLLATQEAHAPAVSEELRRLGLECQLTRNRGELMLLPSGISKGFGVYQVLGDLRISHHSAVGIGDGENDHSLLRTCEIGVAVASAVEGLRHHADIVLEEPGGAALAEFLRSAVLRGEVEAPTQRWRVELGIDRDGERVHLPGSRVNVLVTGRSTSGKSLIAGLLGEQLIDMGYCVCIIDPEGDYASLALQRGVFHLGGQDPVASPDRVGTFMEHRFGSVLVDLSLTDPEERSSYVERLLARLEDERRVNGLPHWILCDEAHDHLRDWTGSSAMSQSTLKGYCLVTYRPDLLDADSRSSVDFILALPGGKRLDEDGIPDPIATLEREHQVDLSQWENGGERDVLLIRPKSPSEVRIFERSTRRNPHVRHWHKYVKGRMPSGVRFYFRTESGDLWAVAANIREFHRTLRSGSEEVLRHHAGRRDFSRWIRDVVQNARLAQTVLDLERDYLESSRRPTDIDRLRAELVEAIEQHYLE